MEKILGEIEREISIGLEYSLRLTRYHGKLVIFNIHNQEIIEYIKNKESTILTENFAIKRLYQLNNLEMVSDEQTKLEIDSTP